MVGDLALALVGAGADPAEFEADPTRFDIPDSVIGFLNGELGDPPGGWPEPFRTKALAGAHAASRAVGELSAQDDAPASSRRRGATLNRLLFPGPTRDFEASRETYSDLSVLPHRRVPARAAAGAEHEVDLEPGKRLLLGVQSVSDADERGLRTVMCTLNGQLRPVRVRDEAVAGRRAAGREGRPGRRRARSRRRSPAWSRWRWPRATPSRPATPVATIEAMKMEAAITAPVAGTVQRLAIGSQQQVEGGDLLLVIG